MRDHHVTLSDRLAGVNGFNALRLALAWLVLFAHSWPLSGATGGPMIGDESLGGMAVAGFFAISGYLITGSRLSLSLPRFAWHRCLRIFPGYWVMLLVVAFVLAPVVSLVAGERWTVGGAVRYVAGTWTTWITDYTMPGTLERTPYGHGGWNGSVWTLLFELICYAVVGVVFAVPVFRRDPAWTLAATCLGVGFVLGTGPFPGLAGFLVSTTLHLGVSFGAGATLRLYGDRVPHHPAIALASALGIVASCLLSQLDSLGAFPMAYLMLWTAGQWRVHVRHDLSYGVYVYAFPIQQAIAATLGVRSPWVMAGMASLLVAPVAAASWFLVERPALRLKRWRMSPSGPDRLWPSVVVAEDHDLLQVDRAL